MNYTVIHSQGITFTELYFLSKKNSKNVFSLSLTLSLSPQFPFAFFPENILQLAKYIQAILYSITELVVDTLMNMKYNFLPSEILKSAKANHHQ